MSFAVIFIVLYHISLFGFDIFGGAKVQRTFLGFSESASACFVDLSWDSIDLARLGTLKSISSWLNGALPGITGTKVRLGTVKSSLSWFDGAA